MFYEHLVGEAVKYSDANISNIVNKTIQIKNDNGGLVGTYETFRTSYLSIILYELSEIAQELSSKEPDYDKASEHVLMLAGFALMSCSDVSKVKNNLYLELTENDEFEIQKLVYVDFVMNITEITSNYLISACPKALLTTLLGLCYEFYSIHSGKDFIAELGNQINSL